MKTSRTRKCLFIGLFASTVIVLGTGSWGQEQDSAVGELKLEGKHVERLVLSQKNGSRKKFDKPGETIKLAVGEYRLQEVSLEGGYSCGITMPISDANWVTVAEDKPAVLKVGAPLKQVVKVERRGSVLQLGCELLGVGGEKYTSDRRSGPPRFIVYKAGKEIASGNFEYG